jgi:hypothetical protein
VFDFGIALFLLLLFMNILLLEINYVEAFREQIFACYHGAQLCKLWWRFPFPIFWDFLHFTSTASHLPQLTSNMYSISFSLHKSSLSPHFNSPLITGLYLTVSTTNLCSLSTVRNLTASFLPLSIFGVWKIPITRRHLSRIRLQQKLQNNGYFHHNLHG